MAPNAGSATYVANAVELTLYQYATSLENRQEGRGPRSKTETELPHINRGGVLSTIFITYNVCTVAHTMCAIAVVFYRRKNNNNKK